jgi:transitional endoplasmic reticulum ATPase
MAASAAPKRGENTLMNLMQMFASGKDGKMDPSKLDALKGDLTGKVEIVRTGDQITLPVDMSLDEGILWLYREKMSQEAEVAINEQIPIVPWDGAVAFYKVLQHKYGFVNLVKTPTMFGPKPPHMIGVRIGPKAEDFVQVPWGRFELPGIEGYLQTSVGISDNRPVFIISGVVKRASEQVVAEIARLVREELKKNSIYRGKAIKVEFHSANAMMDNPFDEKFMPKFMDLPANGTPVILNADAEHRLEVELYQIVKHTERCRKFNIPLKRGVLLEGPYGTGKTLTAHDLAACCVKNGWTFIYVENASTLEAALKFAQFYQPCVIFAEDIDKVILEHDDPDLTTIRNALDSVETKNTEISVVLTTNHIDKLPEGFLRCGRIDSIVTISRPDTASTVKLVRLYGGTTIRATDDALSAALQPIVGQSAALIRECVERAKLAAIDHIDENTGEMFISAEDLGVTAKTLANHAMLQGRGSVRNEVHPAQAAHTQLLSEVKDTVKGLLREIGHEFEGDK